MKFNNLIGVFLLYTFCLSSVFSQSKKTDSLWLALKQAKEDTAKVNTLNALSFEFRYINTDTSGYFANTALALATKLNYEMGIADSKVRIGMLCATLGKYENGAKSAEEALVLYKKILSADNESTKERLLRKIGSTYNVIGHNRISQGNYPQGLEVSFMALKIREELGDKKGISDTEYNIGNIYISQHNYPEALKHYYASLKLSEQLGIKKDICWMYNAIGYVYFQQGNDLEASKNYSIAIRLADEVNDQFTLGEIYINQATMNDRKRNYSEALKYNFDALKIYVQIGNKEQIGFIYNNIGSIYTKQKKYNLASEYLKKALSFSKKSGNLIYTILSYENWSSLDSAQGDYKHSLEHYKVAVAYRDSLINAENSKKIVQQQMQYAFDKKEDSLKQKQFIMDTKLTVQKKQKYFYWAGLALLALLSIFVFQNFRNQKKINKLAIEAHAKQKAELELQNQQAILKERLRISSELHDEVGATLSGIAMYSHLTKEQMKRGLSIEIEKSLNVMQESSTQMVDKLSDIVWLINPEQDPLEKLITRLEEYAIQMAAIKDMKVKIHVPEKIADIHLPIEQRRNIYLFCKEAINNAVKYSNATTLELSIKEMDGKLEFSVSDNGQGFDAVMVRRGNGLENMQKRADDIGAKLILQSKLNEGALVSMQCKVS
jgi:two-component system, NarL family, sensor histidine kinase UhpB